MSTLNNMKKSQAGSLMIEALAMLALIALITPILYKKSAERTTELQDINAASEMRAIIKGVDDYISTNYNTIVSGTQSVENSCAGDYGTQEYHFNAEGDSVDASISVPLGHFCEFLPYGILGNGDAPRQSRLFSDNYQVILKIKGEHDKNKVVTAFVVTEPNGDTLPTMRASSISSMIGGNGGYVTDATGNGKIAGTMGIWGIDNIKSELGIDDFKAGAVVAASIQGISSQNAKLNMEEVLYRLPQTDPELNSMSTDLLMKTNDITNIGHLVVGAEASAGEEAALYIDSGDIRINGEGSAYLENGDITITQGGLYLNQGNAEIGGDVEIKASETDGNGGNLVVESTILGAMAEEGKYIFQVAADGAVQALSYITNGLTDGGTKGAEISDEGVFYKDGENKFVRMNSDGILFKDGTDKFEVTNEKVTVNEPVNIKGTGTYEDVRGGLTYELDVEGNAYIANDLKIGNTFDAKNLHAREKLTVGGDTTGVGKVLRAEYDKESDTGEIEGTAGRISFDSGGASILMEDNEQTLSADNYINLVSPLIEMRTDENRDPAFMLEHEAGNDTILSRVNSFTIQDTDKTDTTSDFFKVHKEGDETIVDIADLNTYMRHADQYIQDGVFHLQRETVGEGTASYNDVVRIGVVADGDNAQIDISGDSILAKDTAEEKILKINLAATPDDSDTNYPVYVRKGAIELTDHAVGEEGSSNYDGHTNYVKADRFVANTQLLDGALKTQAGGNSDLTKYEVNPAYTSVMHDIKLTTRGGARLSDILPDFINKGIYVVDNTYPAFKSSCKGHSGKTVEEYQKSALSIDWESCESYSDEVSPWAGFVPTPTCPPGYSKVITLMPASFAMAQAGIPMPKSNWGSESFPDLLMNYDVKSPYDYLDESSTDVAPTPLYFQKNTWLKSFVSTCYGDNCNTSGGIPDFKGWSVGMGFIYPYIFYRNYLTDLGFSENSGDTGGTQSGSTDTRVIWNLFPVNNGTLEGYATVYCYFDRSDSMFSDTLVDKEYDQLNNFRGPTEKTNAGYTGRLNPTGYSTDVW